MGRWISGRPTWPRPDFAAPNRGFPCAPILAFFRNQLPNASATHFRISLVLAARLSLSAEVVGLDAASFLSGSSPLRLEDGSGVLDLDIAKSRRRPAGTRG